MQYLSKHGVLYALDGLQEQEKNCNCDSRKDFQRATWMKKASELMAHKPLSHTITPQYLGNLPSDFLGIFRKWTSQIFLSKGWIGRQHSCTSIKPWVSFELKRKSLSRHTDPNYCLKTGRTAHLGMALAKSAHPVRTCMGPEQPFHSHTSCFFSWADQGHETQLRLF